MATVDVRAELAALGKTLDAYGEIRERMGDRLFESAAQVSAWSCAQHLYHVAFATDLAFRNVAALVAGKGAMIVDEGAPNELALRVLADGHYPRGESEAPRMVQPGDDVNPEFLFDEMRRNREGLEGLREIEELIPAAPQRIPHHYLGQLNAAEWLRFAQLHARHHLEIARDVEAGLE